MPGLLLERHDNRVEELTSALFHLRNAFISLVLLAGV